MQQTDQPMPENLSGYFKNLIGQKLFLNADNRQPAILQEVHNDHLRLATAGAGDSPHDHFIIPLRSIVSVQEVEGLDGVVVYLVR